MKDDEITTLDSAGARSAVKGLATKVDINALETKFVSALSSTKIWAVVLYIGLAAVLLAAMARGFKWI